MSTGTALNESLDAHGADLRLSCFLMFGREDQGAPEEILERASRVRDDDDHRTWARARLFGIATEVCFERLGVAP